MRTTLPRRAEWLTTRRAGTEGRTDLTDETVADDMTSAGGRTAKTFSV